MLYYFITVINSRTTALLSNTKSVAFEILPYLQKKGKITNPAAF